MYTKLRDYKLSVVPQLLIRIGEMTFIQYVAVGLIITGVVFCAVQLQRMFGDIARHEAE